MTAALIRVLLVDDSSLAREMLREILQQESGIEVVGEAVNGREAIEKARLLKPNLITLDLEMPVMSGMDAITAIMCDKAVPILVVSGVADAQKAYEAVRRGALDVVNKPDASPASMHEFVSKVRMLAGVPVITHIRPVADLSAAPPRLPPQPAKAVDLPPAATTTGSGSQRVFAIACSTGGPQVLATLLPQLPTNFPCPVLVAQHISEGFASGMADWLAGLCRLPVRLAVNGEAVCPGVIYISPAEYHCTVSPSRRIVFVERAEHDLYRPSCDRLLESVAEVYREDAVGIILTGMGRDGTLGIARIRGCGGVTLGQDAATSLIYGMNRCAIEAGTVQSVLPDTAIAAEMLKLAGAAV